jgi:hypothetical protein
MTLIERATNSANTVATETVSTVSKAGTAIAEGVVVTVRDVRTGIKDGRIRGRTVVVASAIGLFAVVEWPVLVAVGGAAVIYSKLKKRPDETEEEPVSAPGDDTE